MFSLICVWINGWVNNSEAGDLRRHRGHYDVNVMNDEWAFIAPLSINLSEIGIKNTFLLKKMHLKMSSTNSATFLFALQLTWWRHIMETISAWVPLPEGNPPVIPRKGPVLRSFDVSYDVSLNRQFNKQWSRRWFETPWRPCGITNEYSHNKGDE